ncbi:hypothetical protein [Marinomonas sp. THO17]|uniref:hypothetical protein n=1 Tax=Marinomonas sp. THO17 TaxID=3149048 RepID=UPI00336BD56D
MMKKEATILVRFLSAAEGGRQSSIGCLLMIDDTQAFDCRFILDGTTVFELGMEYDIAVKFLNPENVLSHLNEEDEISLWEGKKIGAGIVKKIFSDSET